MNALKKMCYQLICWIMLPFWYFRYYEHVARIYGMSFGYWRQFNEKDEVKLMRYDVIGKYIKRYIVKPQLCEKAQLELFNHPKADKLLPLLAENNYLYPSVQAKVFELDKDDAEIIMAICCLTGKDLTEDSQVKLLDLPNAWDSFVVYVTNTTKVWHRAAQLKFFELEDSALWIVYYHKLKKALCPEVYLRLMEYPEMYGTLLTVLKGCKINPIVWQEIIRRQDAPKLVEHIVSNLNPHSYDDLPPECQSDILAIENRDKILKLLLQKQSLIAESIQNWMFENMREEYLERFGDGTHFISDNLIPQLLEHTEMKDFLLTYVGNGGAFSDESQVLMTEKLPLYDAYELMALYLEKNNKLCKEAQMLLAISLPDTSDGWYLSCLYPKELLLRLTSALDLSAGLEISNIIFQKGW